MSAMKDFYPDETKSFDNLPDDSPLQFLSYGGLLTNISDRVKIIRKEKRNIRRKFLIKKINNIHIEMLIRQIQYEAKKLSKYKVRQWTKGGINKKAYLKFFEKNDISLRYLEDIYLKQLKGPIKLKIGDHISIDNTHHGKYGIVIKVSSRHIQYQCCGEKIINGNALVPVPDFENYEYETWGSVNIYGYTVSIWRCTKIGSDTVETIQKRNTNYLIKKDEYIRRELFWRNYIKPLSDTIRMPYNYYSYNFDLFKGERPAYISVDDKYVWDIITDILNNKLTNEQSEETLGYWWTNVAAKIASATA